MDVEKNIRVAILNVIRKANEQSVPAEYIMALNDIYYHLARNESEQLSSQVDALIGVLARKTQSEDMHLQEEASRAYPNTRIEVQAAIAKQLDDIVERVGAPQGPTLSGETNRLVSAGSIVGLIEKFWVPALKEEFSDRGRGRAQE